MPEYVIPSNSNGLITVHDLCDAINLLEPNLRRRVAEKLREAQPQYGWIIQHDGALDAVY